MGQAGNTWFKKQKKQKKKQQKEGRPKERALTRIQKCSHFSHQRPNSKTQCLLQSVSVRKHNSDASKMQSFTTMLLQDLLLITKNSDIYIKNFFILSRGGTACTIIKPLQVLQANCTSVSFNFWLHICCPPPFVLPDLIVTNFLMTYAKLKICLLYY